jgi:serine/threonine protein kinase
MSTFETKSFKICNVLGGLDVTRYVSSNTRHVFHGAIEDVELIREYVSQAAANQGIVGGFSNLNEMNHSLQWEARGFQKEITTVEAGLGYVDDRSGRIIDRFVAVTVDQPLVGDKQTDMRIADTVSNIFPWLVDRRSVEENWYAPHQDGRSEGPADEPFLVDSLYTAAWIGTYGSAWVYYPPMTVFSAGHPMTFGDVVGGDSESHELPFVKPNLPSNNPTRRAFLGDPYADFARPGLSLITAMAPIYFTGTFGNYTYNDTYIASTGVDIAIQSTSSLLDTLLDKMTVSSFAILVDLNFHAIVISQTVVNRIFPTRTGFEESRVTYSLVDGSVVEDRRNQTYLVSDTIHEDLIKLKNAKWHDLLLDVQRMRPGERGVSKLNVTLTGEDQAKEFYVMYERWDSVADWIMLAFAPTSDVDHAIDVGLYNTVSHQNEAPIELTGEWGYPLFGEAILVNKGALDVAVTSKGTPTWFSLYPDNLVKRTLATGETLSLQFNVDTVALDVGTLSFALTFTIQDDDYPDCFYNQDISLPVIVKISPKDCISLTGDPMRVAAADGSCVCLPISLEIGGICCPYIVLVPSIIIPLALLGLVGVYLYVDRKRKQADSVWLIKPSDLHFDDTPEVLGRGTFGLVVRAEYRGTQVAVKRVIPPPKQGRNRSIRDITGRNSVWSMYGRSSSETTQHFNFRSKILGSNGSDKQISIETVTTDGSLSTIADNKQYSKLKAEFVNEMRLLSKLRHPCITTIMGAMIESGEEPLLVMELMDLGSLFDLLHNDTLFVEGYILLQVLRDISQGMRFLHAAAPQVIHGDLKTHNVLVDGKFRAKIADFGLSQKKQVGAVGTPFWMAPELLRGESVNTAASDVYSFGIVLYEVYSRSVPYDGEDFDETIQEICDPRINKRPPVPRPMPSEVVELMTECIHADVLCRPTFREIDDKLKSFSVKNVEPGQVRYSMQAKKSLEAKLAATENLLLEIFPKHVAEALSKGQKVEPQHFDCVTIFFSDIVGFTNIASELSPWKVSDMLDRLYSKFDTLSRKHDVFKVETIGDAWMGVTNLATPQSDHTKRIVMFAMDAIRAASSTLVDEDDLSRGFLSIRVGFHSGPVIATVVGSRNPKYTLIGDTVNTSSRMESNSLPGCILCSSPAAKLLNEQVHEFSVTSRGRIEVKGKGALETFWVTETMGEIENGFGEQYVNENTPLLPSSRGLQ